MDISGIREHMDVVGSDGQHVGTVDSVGNDRIKLTRSDPAAGGEHHYVPTSLVARVNNRVELTCSAEEARAAQSSEQQAGGRSGGTGLSSAQL